MERRVDPCLRNQEGFEKSERRGVWDRCLHTSKILVRSTLCRLPSFFAGSVLKKVIRKVDTQAKML
jgi:hypothetical protein